MKITALVSYSSSEDDDQPIETHRPLKKRKLPPLPSSLTCPAPIDDPSLHQGRIRTTPHKEGQFAAYVYVAIVPETSSPLRLLLDTVFKHAKQSVPTLHVLDLCGDGAGQGPGSAEGHELHISLSRPIFLNAHQHEDLKRAVKAVATQHPSFEISFATFSELTNDERTRTFLTMEVGAGHTKLRAIADALTPTWKVLRQKEFYVDPKFHASIGWALLDHPSSTGSYPPSMSASPLMPRPLPPVPSQLHKPFLTIPHFPPTLIKALNDEYSARLVSKDLGKFDVEDICLKIGKSIFKWRLVGR